MGGHGNRPGARGLRATAERGRVVIKIGRDVEITYNGTAGAIELRVDPASAQAFAGAVLEAADTVLG